MVLRELRRSDRERLRGREPDRDRVGEGRRHAALDAAAQALSGSLPFGINAYTATEAGQDVVEEHNEERLGHEELYVVVAGRATFVLDGEEMEVPAGLGRLPARSEGEALRTRRGAGNDGARDRRQARFARVSRPGSTSSPPTPLPTTILDARDRRDPGRARREAGPRGAALPPRVHQRPRGEARRGADDSSTARSSSIRSCRSGRTRTRTWLRFASSG